MRHYDPDDPIWTEDEDRAAARAESLEDWHRDEGNDEHTYVTVTGFLRDEGTVVQFETAEGPVLCVPHVIAEALLAVLNVDGEVPVAVEAWSVL